MKTSYIGGIMIVSLVGIGYLSISSDSLKGNISNPTPDVTPVSVPPVFPLTMETPVIIPHQNLAKTELYDWNIKRTLVILSPGATKWKQDIRSTLQEVMKTGNYFLLDTPIPQFLADASISRQEKMSLLMSLLPEIKKHEDARDYILSTLGELHPIEYVSDLIAYGRDMSPEKQYMIARTVGSAFSIDFPYIEGNLEKIHYLEGQQAIARGYVREYLPSITDRRLLEEFMQMHLSIMDGDVSLQPMLLKALDVNRSLFAPQEYTSLKYRMLSNSDTASIEFRTFLQESSKAGSGVTDQIFFEIYMFMRNANPSMYISTLPPASRQALSEYLSTNIPRQDSLINREQWMDVYGKWADATVLLKDGNYAEQLNTFLRQHTPIEQSALLMQIARNKRILTSDMIAQIQMSGVMEQLRLSAQKLPLDDQKVIFHSLDMFSNILK